MPMRPLLLLLTPLALAMGLEDPTVRLKEIDQEAMSQKATYLRTWLGKANLEALPAVQLGADPRDSEKRTAEQTKVSNSCLEGIRQFKKGPEFRDDMALLGRLHPMAIQAILDAEALRKAGPGLSAARR
jgi:hypothetical protein